MPMSGHARLATAAFATSAAPPKSAIFARTVSSIRRARAVMSCTSSIIAIRRASAGIT